MMFDELFVSNFGRFFSNRSNFINLIVVHIIRKSKIFAIVDFIVKSLDNLVVFNL